MSIGFRLHWNAVSTSMSIAKPAELGVACIAFVIDQHWSPGAAQGTRLDGGVLAAAAAGHAPRHHVPVWSCLVSALCSQHLTFHVATRSRAGRCWFPTCAQSRAHVSWTHSTCIPAAA